MRASAVISEVVGGLPRKRLKPLQRRWRRVRHDPRKARRFFEALCRKLGLGAGVVALCSCFENADLAHIDILIFEVPGRGFYAYRVWTPDVGCIGTGRAPNKCAAWAIPARSGATVR